MLEAVGHPTAVNPDDELRAIAEDRGWPILDFQRPVAMKPRVEAKQAVAASVALTAVALGIAWYARRRRISA